MDGVELFTAALALGTIVWLAVFYHYGKWKKDAPNPEKCAKLPRILETLHAFLVVGGVVLLFCEQMYLLYFWSILVFLLPCLAEHCARAAYTIKEMQNEEAV